MGHFTITDFTPRDMLRLLEEMPRPTNFLQSMFVKERNATNKVVLDIDKIFGKQLVARYSSREGDMNVVGKGGFSTNHFVAPYVTEKFCYKPSDIDIRGAGLTVYDDQVAYLSRFVERALNDLEDRFDRLEELQLAEALQEGTVTVDGKETNYTIDFEQSADHLVDSLDTDWSDPDAPMLDNLATYSALISDTGAPPPDVMICGGLAGACIPKNTAFLAALDNRRLMTGEINYQQLNQQRATYIGRVTGIGFDLAVYVYQGIYEKMVDGTRTAYRYIDPWNVILGSTNADVRFHYAKIENFKTGDFIGTRFPNQTEDDDGRQRAISLESSPLVGFHQTNAFVRLTVGSDD
jgi:hypothetical protein